MPTATATITAAADDVAAITGNGDMHLKNWSLLYPGDGRTPKLSPVYDVLSTIPYIPKDGLALSLAGEKSFKALTPERWRNFANRSGRAGYVVDPAGTRYCSAKGARADRRPHR